MTDTTDTAVQQQTTHHGYTSVKVGQGTLLIGTGEVTVQDADTAPPDNTTTWAPPPKPSDGVYYQYDGAWVLGLDVREATLDALKAVSLAECQDVFEAAVADLQGNYSASERQSWPRQISEAQAYLGGDTGGSLLSVLATTRGIDVSDLAQSIVARDEAYQASYGLALANLQKARDAISAAQALEDLPSLSVQYLVRAYAKARTK